MEAVKRGLQRGLSGRRRTVVLFSDATIITETPPLRASWSPVGDPARVPITGNRRRGVLYGALNPRSGHICLDEASRWNGESFREHLRNVRREWSGWNIVLFLDRGSPHTAHASRELAGSLKIETRWLPTACPELNPVEDLWRWLKNTILCNHQPDDFADTMQAATEAIQSLTNKDIRRLTGTLSKNFWIPT